ncbi:hypothetical protein CGLAMM_05640 [Acetobacteraceae bacterium EV16G]|uniref:Uncharacterized protein n=1 Tax=Sorlinia euscelidii TaxID=3081148 RepID=A0ABU7TZS4_9PROT
MKSALKIFCASSVTLGLAGCSLDPASRQDSWEPTNTPDKNIQAMLVDKNDWQKGRHDADVTAPFAVDAIEHFKNNTIPALPKNDAGFKPSGS